MKQDLAPVPSAQPQMPGQRISGIDCPKCQNFIPISISQLLDDRGIMCPHCALSMTINRSQSKEALDILKNVEKATQQVRNTERFRR